jgi:predicted dehydrogenase
MTPGRIRWGILGTSKISETMASAVLVSDTSVLSAVASRSAEKSRLFATRFSIDRSYDSHQALLDDPAVDAVYIGLPNHLHKDWIIRCAKAGKHILCEKPLVMNVSEAEEAYKAVAAAQVVCMEALMYRSHPLTTKLCELINDKIIGDINHFNAVYMADIVDLANPVSSSAILNLGCYPVSLVRLLAGAEPEAMIAFGRLDAEHKDRQASIIMKFNQDMTAAITTADDRSMYALFEIYGTKGRISLMTNPWFPDQTNNKIHVFTKDSTEAVVINVTADKPLYTYQIDLVNQLIYSGDVSKKPGYISREDSMGTIAVLDTWIQQLKKGLNK